MSPTSSVEVYSCCEKPQIIFPDLPIKLDCHSTLRSNKNVYCIGGRLRDHEGNEAISFKTWQLPLNGENLSWKEVAPLKERCHLMGAAVFKDSLIVAGGFGQHKEPTSTVEIHFVQ